MIDVQLEEIERALLLQVKNGLPQALLDIESEYTSLDAAFFAELGVSPVPLTPLPPPALYLNGHHPYILERPLTDFPNVVVNCTSHPSGDAGGFDQTEEIGSSAYVEVFCVHEDPSTVNRMIKRYAKALHRVVSADLTLGGAATLTPELSPEVLLSNQQAGRVDNLHDEVVYFQGTKLEYTFVSTTGTWW